MGNIIVDAELRSLIPPLTPEEYTGLEESILAEGCRDALVLWGDVLVDGHNRYEICTAHGIPFTTVQRDFASRDEAMLWMIDTQFSRRNLEPTDRILLAQKKAPIIERIARQKQAQAGGDKRVEEQGQTAFIQMDNSAISVKPVHVQKEVAKMAGVSTGTLARFEQVQKKKPELIEDIRNGEMSINQAYQTVRREEKKQEVQQRIDEYATVQTGVIDIQNTDRKYNIIYADPPWRYWESGNKNQALHYTTMTIDEICALPVKDIADEDCVLFLWVTYPILQEAFRVIEAWGFTYSTAAFVWVKKNKRQDTPFVGCGAWTRANSELCLLATRGNVMRLDASVSQVVESPIEEHSKKPDVVRDLITQLVGELPRVELFCRNPAEGWDVWGNEA